MSKYILGDIHGCELTLRALVDQIFKDGGSYSDIVLVGDLIDRGTRSRQVVEYVIANNILTVKGNHEDMMAKSLLDSISDCMWTNNGGIETIESYKEEANEELASGEIYKTKVINKDLLKRHAEWMKDLPLYLSFPDIKNESGRHLVVSHSNIGKVWDWSPERKEQMIEQYENIIMWERCWIEDAEDIYNVIGHTPQMNPKIKSFYANIDTGACFNRSDYGVLTCLKFPEMTIFKQQNIDIEPKNLAWE